MVLLVILISLYEKSGQDIYLKSHISWPQGLIQPGLSKLQKRGLKN